MANTKHFLQDQPVLLLVSVNAFMTLLSVTLIILKLIASQGKTTFVTQFRSQPNAVDFVTGGVGFNGTAWDMVSFIVAALGFMAIGALLAYRVHSLNRQLAIVTLSLTAVLLLFLIAVSNILLGLR
jgi:hypothetical protein